MPIVKGKADPKAKYRFSHVGYMRTSDVRPLGTTLSPTRPDRPSVRSAKDRSIQISWPRALGAQGYQLQARRAGTAKYATIATLSGTSFTHTGLRRGTVYQYRVRSTNMAAGRTVRSGYSKVLRAATRPAKVAGVTAAPSGFTENTVSWRRVNGATGYVVQRSSGQRGGFSTIATVKGETSHIDTGLDRDTRYRYRVQAMISQGSQNLRSPQSDIVTAALTKDARPGNVRASARSEKGSVRVSWRQVRGAAGYEIHRSRTRKGDYRLIEDAGRRTRAFTDTKRSTGREVFYRIRAYTLVDGQKVYGRFAPAVSAVPN
jgi:fibronectin type 3 domain-containing protein